LRGLKHDQTETQETTAVVGTGSSVPRRVALAGLVVGAVGIALLWAGGQDFPIYPPPGILILLGGVFFVALARWRWAPAVAAVLGLFVIVGFVLSGFASGTGFDNLVGNEGPLRAVGTVVQLIGTAVAVVAGALAASRNYSNGTA
jgi:hypothetical protein